MHLYKSLSLASGLGLAVAWDFSLFTKTIKATQQPFEAPVPDAPQPVRVAIIGAGAGGSSAAFFIQKAKERHGIDVDVDIFDKVDYIGGRSTTVHPYDDASLPSEELGASIFVQANKILWRAMSEFNLTFGDLAEEGDDMGIYDGKDMLITYTGGWWDNIKMLWRYGYSAPTTARTITRSMVEKLMEAYTPDFTNWKTIEELSESLGFDGYTKQTGYEFFTSRGVGELFVKELIDAATRCNYAQNIDKLHGLEAAVTMAASGATQVAGGNWQIFDNFVKHSKANVYLGTTVTGLSKTATSGKTQWTLSGASSDIPKYPYDHVIIAAPWHNAGLSLLGSSATFEPKVEYTHLHVTLLSTTAYRPRPEKFGLKAGTDLPRTILTTSAGERKGGPAPEINSVSYHRKIVHDGREEYVFKIFSMQTMTDEYLEEMFGAGTLGWVYRKEWDSYPKVPPVSHYPALKADDGLWYVNSMESFISTMETEALSGRNIADHVVQESFGVGICNNSTHTGEDWKSTVDETKVYGWDC